MQCRKSEENAMSDIIMQIQDIVKEFPLADGSTLRACNGISIDVER